MESIIIFAGRLMRYLWPVTWQISILVVAVIVIERLFRRSATMFRYLLWCLVLARLCLPLNHIIRYVSRLFPERAAHMVHKAGELYGMTFNTIIDVPGSFLSVEHSGHSFPELFLLFISAAYCIGLLGYMVLAFISFFRTRQLLRHCVPVINSDILALFGKLTRELNIRQPVELLSIDTEKVKMPSYTGIFRPRIVLSGAIVDEWSVEDCEPILLHELYHIKRRDMALNWLQIAVQAVYFFNPFVWYANNRLRAVREELCDDGVVRHLGSGFTRYALSLLRIVEETSLDNRPGFVLIQLIGHENRIKERIRRIMKNDYKKNEILSVPSILILTALAVITVVFACVETDNITSTSSPVSKTVQQDIESPLIVKIYKNGTYEIGGVPATKDDFERIYRDQLVKHNYFIGGKVETERGTDDESIRFYAETIERIHKDLDKEIRVAAKERTLRLRQNALVPEIKEEGILSEASKMLSFIIQAEKNYYTSEKNYIDFDFGNDCKPIGFVHPENAHYEYAFKGDKALARERIDVNNDGDTDDGITLSVNEVEGILSGSSLKGNNEVSSGTIHKSLKISILENGDYEIDGKRVSPSQLEQALIENKDKISDPKTIMEIQFKTTSEKEKPSGYYLLIKTIQKIGINIDTSNVEKSFPE